MYWRLSFNLIVLAVMIAVLSGLLTPRWISAQQQPQTNKDQAQPETQSQGQEEKDPTKSMVEAYPALFKAIPVAKKDDELRKLQIERFEAAQVQVTARYLQYAVGSAVPGAGGRSPLIFLLEAYRQLLDSRLDLVEKPEEEIAVLEDFLKIAKESEKTTKGLLDSGKTDLAEFARIRYARADAEIQLLKAKRRLKK
jgi:hypothetical protein